MSRTPVWIDTDLAVGVPGADVDDGLAVLAALHSPELAVAGISTTYGNGGLDDVDRLTRELVGLDGAPVAVHRGPAAADQLGEQTAATRALSDALAESPDLVVLALGPLTTVATVLGERDRGGPVPPVVLVGGRRPGQEFTVGHGDPMGDFNVECDPQAVEALLATPAALTLTGFEVASHVELGAAELDRLAAGPPAARWLAEPARRWLELWRERFGVDGFHPFDTLAVAAVAAPSTLVTAPAAAAMTTRPDARVTWRGDAPAAASLQVDLDSAPGRPVRYATRPREGFVEDLMTRLLRR